MVIVQFRGHLVQQYRASVIDSLGLGITCFISLYYVYAFNRLEVPCTTNESDHQDFLKYTINAGQTRAIPIYTVLPYCVIQ